MATTDANQPTPKAAMRLIFEYEGDTVRLVSQQPVDVAITGFDIASAQHPGWYVDTRDAAGHALARVAAHGAFPSGAEVFPEQHGEPITRSTGAKPRGAFTVVVPVPEGADHVAVVNVAPAQPAATVSASRAQEKSEIEIARFPLQITW
jgi:hypothetical protein